VHAGLPRDFTDPWHDWQSMVVAGSRTMMGDAWLDAFLEAPVWRFVLPPGMCGPRAVVGLIMPSVDKVGRYFPLTFAALSNAGTPNAEEWSGWLDTAEDLGRLALDEDAPPDRLMPPPAPLSPSIAGETSKPPACRCLPCPMPRVSRPCWAISHHRRVRHDNGTNPFLARHP
jgi:type VI secretion system protein ImpM